MLLASDLTREFRTARTTVTAVDRVTMALQPGEFVAIVGRSGSGKSTLLSLLGSLDRPTSGTVTIGGENVTALSESALTAFRRDRIGFVFQSFNLVPNLTALGNVMLPMEFAGVSRIERRSRAELLLASVGIDPDMQRRRPGHLSGGEQQRVAIARALANRPALLLADEPTGNLDSETGKIIVSLLRELARTQNVTVVSVTHDLEVAAKADRTFRLQDGRMTEGAEANAPSALSEAIAAANRAFDAWLLDRDEHHLSEFVQAVQEMIDAAPSDRRLSVAKIRDRYREAVGEPSFDGILEGIDGEAD